MASRRVRSFCLCGGVVLALAAPVSAQHRPLRGPAPVRPGVDAPSRRLPSPARPARPPHEKRATTPAANPETRRTSSAGDVRATAGDPLPLLAAFEGAPYEGHSLDFTVAAGPESLILATNDGLAIRQKTGELVASLAGMSAFFDSVRQPQEFLGDPRVVYDPATERFFLAAIGLDPQDVRRRCTPGDCTAHFFVAVSKSSRPASLETGDWYFYALDSTLDGAEPTARWADFVQLGLNDTVLVLTANMNGFGGGASTGTKIRILEKAKLVAGEPVSWTDFAGVRDPSGFTGFTPVLHLDRTHRFFLVRPCGSSTAGPTIVEIRDPLSSPTLVFQSVPALAHCRTEHYVDGRQPTGLGLSTGGAAGAIYRNQSLWNAEVTTVEFEGTPVAAVRWYQIDVSGWPAEPALVQTSVLADAGISYFVSALAVDEADNMAMVVARSSAHEFPSIYYTGRHVSDSAGVLRSPALLKAGTTSLIADDSRYGDYFGAAIDAADGSAWLVGQFVSGTTKSTSWVGRVSLPGFTGRRLFPGQSISSRNGRFRLLYRADGNLVLDDDEARETVWSADTQSPTPGMAIMQLDGNLVVYDRDGHVRWSSGTFGNRNAYLGVEDDGNLVIYAWDGRPLWDRFHSRREDR